MRDHDSVYAYYTQDHNSAYADYTRDHDPAYNTYIYAEFLIFLIRNDPAYNTHCRDHDSTYAYYTRDHASRIRIILGITTPRIIHIRRVSCFSEYLREITTELETVSACISGT